MRKTDVRLYRRLLRTFQRVEGLLQGGPSCCSGLTLAQCHVLLEVEEAGEGGVGDLAARVGLDKSTVSRTVDSLVKMKLLARATNEADRRYCRLSLTAKGIEKTRVIHQLNDEIVRQVFSLIPREQHEDVLASLRLLVEAHVEAGRRSPADPKNQCCQDK